MFSVGAERTASAIVSIVFFSLKQGITIEIFIFSGNRRGTSPCRRGTCFRSNHPLRDCQIEFVQGLTFVNPGSKDCCESYGGSRRGLQTHFGLNVIALRSPVDEKISLERQITIRYGSTLMTCDRKILFLLAHQDDEIFVATRISFELSRGRSPYLVYLTNGASTAQNVAVRDHESRMFLRHLGIAPKQVVFLGSEFQIPDGHLVNRFEECFELLLEKVEGHMFQEIYAPAWEGGHQDHDAAFLIGLALARRLGLEICFWQFYCYNGFNTRGRFFRVIHPLPKRVERRERRFTLCEGFTVLRSIVFFKSQKKTWLGLLPQTVIYLLFLRTEVFHRGTGEQVAAPAHKGRLLYERWKRMSYGDFETKARKFQRDFIMPTMPRADAESNGS